MRPSILIAIFTFVVANAAQAQSRIEIVGSSNVFPFAAAVGEHFARNTSLPTPRVLPTGTGGGIDLFCAGLGRPHPDFVGTTRPMTELERRACRANGIRNITQIKIGFEALVLARPKSLEGFDLTKEQIFAALAKEVEVEGKIVSNPNVTWRDVAPTLPEKRIRVFGPPQSSEHFDGFIRLAMLPACDSFPKLSSLNEEAKSEVCSRVRGDGSFRAADYLGVLKELQGRSTSIGLINFSLYAKYDDMVSALPIAGVEPTLETVARGDYPLARPLFLYTKNQHYQAIDGFLQFIDEFTSDRALGPEGYLVEEGLIPLSDEERDEQRRNAIGLNPFW